MKFKIKNSLVDNYKVFLRRAGYALIFDRRRGVESFVKRLGNGHYPRLHLYVNEVEANLIFNLHLDQKKASYEGYHMHNAEYDNEIVEEEINRLKGLLGFSEAKKEIKNNFNSFKRSTQSTFNNKDTKREQTSRSDLTGNLESDLNRLQKTAKKKKRFLFFNI